MSALGRYARLLAVEIAKLRRQRLALTVVAVPSLTAALAPQAIWLSGREGASGHSVLATSLQFAFLLGTFLLFLHAALSVAAERSERTLREVIAGPVRRSEVLLARWSALELELLLVVALATGLAWLSTRLHYDFVDLRGEAVAPIFYAEELAHASALAVLYFVPAAAAVISLGLLVSVLAATPATAAALGLGALLILDVLKALLSSASWGDAVLVNIYLPTLFDRTSYLHAAAAAADGVSDLLWLDDDPRHRLNLLVPLAYTLGSLAAAITTFTRKDFVE